MGNPFIPDEIEKFAKQLPAMVQKVDAMLTEGQIFLRELHDELTILRKMRRNLQLALKDDV